MCVQSSKTIIQIDVKFEVINIMKQIDKYKIDK